MTVVARAWFPAALFLVAAIFYGLAGTIEAPGWQPGQITASAWPRAMLMGLMVCALLQIRRSLRAPEVAVVAERPSPDADVDSAPHPGVLVLAMGAILGYVLLSDLVGFTLATFTFFLGFATLAGWRRSGSLVAVAAVGTLTTLYLFAKAVYLPLPKGHGAFQHLTIALYRLLRLF
jgi:hypothetical protein